jgi:exosome complex RNA-binding protein Csl4
MVPKSWEEMECPVTGVVEKRKVADPRTLTNNATPAAGQTA